MLQAMTEIQRSIIGMTVLEGDLSEVDVQKDGIAVNGFITFDQMAEIVDYLRKSDYEKRAKSRRAAIKSDIDKLWVSGDTIFLKGADVEKTEAFILSLAEFGYDTKELLNEYKRTGKITI